jgi:Tol biopolymer transport system component
VTSRRQPISKDGEFPRWSPDSKHILEKDLDGDTIVVVSPNGTNRHAVIRVPIFDAVASAAWSPDGKSIAYVGTNGLHIVDVQSGNDRLLNRLVRLCGPNQQPGCADLDWQIQPVARR